ncbi:MAG TPA: hypothetical protein VJ583_09290 [Nitrososphaeraceae archaeon]|nr:hypothetical protein [Nitrososphaeraceae archaeon]
MKIKRALPLIEENYYIIVDYSTQKITYHRHRYQLRSNKFYASKWMMKTTKQ